MSKNIQLSIFQQHIMIAPPEVPMKYHQHKSIEISYVKDGYFTIEYYSQNSHKIVTTNICKHQFVIIKPECKHRMIFPATSETIGVEFVCRSGNILDFISNSEFIAKFPHARNLLQAFDGILIFNDTYNIEYQLRQFKKYTDPNYFDEYTDTIFLLDLKRLLVEILRCNSPTKNLIRHPYINKAISYINLNFYKNIKTKHVAKFLNISEVYLQKLFNKELCVSVTEVINKTKIDKSLELITNTNFSLSKIAKDVGFNSSQAFIINFRKINGCTPSFYKKNYAYPKFHFYRKD